MSTLELTSTVRELKELKRMQEELNTEITALEDSIKAHMTEYGVSIVTTAEYKVTWCEVTTNRLDTTALKRELPDVAARYTKASTIRRFTVQ